MSERPHKRLKIWNKIMLLIKEIYLISENFPKHELFGLTSQMRKAAVSIASNIAEGSARKGKNERIQFYSIAKGSLSELDAQLEIAVHLSYLLQAKYISTVSDMDEVSRMLQGLINNYEGKDRD